MDELQLQHRFTIHAELGPVTSVGTMRQGERRFVPIIGGVVDGPALTGSILPLGGDSQVLISDTLTAVSAHYFIRTRDGVGISVFNNGLRHATPDVARRLFKGEPVAPSEYYFRTAPRFEAPAGSPYEWLNEFLFVGKAERELQAAIIHVFQIL